MQTLIFCTLVGLSAITLAAPVARVSRGPSIDPDALFRNPDLPADQRLVESQPLYPFGFGLSYTTFAYTSLTTSAPALSPRGEVTLSVGVKNTGTRAGDEVVQVYASYPTSKVARPARQLVGFERIALAAGESKSVSIPVAASRLAYWDAEHRAFVVEPGPVQLWAGGSSADATIHTMLTVGESR